MEGDDGKPPAGYLYRREELRFEHQLLGSRMTSYMTGQSFLFTTVAVARTMEWHGLYWFSGALVPLVGIAAACVQLFSMHAASGRMDEWRAKGKRFEGKHSLIVLHSESKPKKSLMFTTLMPWLFIAVWLAMAVTIHVFQPQGGDGM